LKPLVIYDGQCNICAGNLPWLYRLDWLKKFDALPFQSDEVYRRYPGVARADCEHALHVAFPNGSIYKGADAFRAVFLRMPATAVVGLLMSIPPILWLFEKLYPLLARNRYRIGGTCELAARPQVTNPRGEDTGGEKRQQPR
jgi:predicted DCC family thiol-disulfide oxidoreductase YuxK